MKNRISVYVFCCLLPLSFALSTPSNESLTEIVNNSPLEPACAYRIPQNIEWCDFVADRRIGGDTCQKSLELDPYSKKNPLCKKWMDIAFMSVEPYHTIVNELLDVMMMKCCQLCLNASDFYHYEGPKDFADELNAQKSKFQFDIVFPVLGVSGENDYFGYQFLPVVKINSMMLISLKKSKVQMMNDLVAACAKLWPLLTVCILMAFVAGFFGWILDTWYNVGEFPRPFFSGVYEGFWWSFVSMTTVGYGDKAPRSIMARIFSVGWILIGITICSMFTASLTSAITEAAEVQATQIKGLKFGILSNRVLEAYLISKHGGIVEISTTHFDVLLEFLDNKKIDAIFMDLSSAYDYENNLITEKYQITWHDISSESMAYGAVFRNLEFYDYFNSFMTDNEVLFQACIGYKKSTKKTKLEKIDVFAPSSGLFWPFFYGSIATIIIMMCAGGVYEYFRRKKKLFSIESKPKHNENYILKIIDEMEDVLKRLKEKKE